VIVRIAPQASSRGSGAVVDPASVDAALSAAWSEHAMTAAETT
jgi:hypothetical protein